MARMLEIPGPFKAHQEQQTTLEGVTYLLRFDWIQRVRRWKFSIYTPNGVALLAGKSLVAGPDLLRLHRTVDGIPPGQLVCIAQQGISDPTWRSFRDGTHTLLYFESQTPESGVAPEVAPGGAPPPPVDG